MKNQIRALPWWALALAALSLMFMAGFIADGYLLRAVGAVFKTSLGLALGYYAHRHLILQGGQIDPGDDSSIAQSKRLSRAIIMAACALAVALAP